MHTTAQAATTELNLALTDEAWQHHRKIIRNGQAKKRLTEEQLQELHWLYRTPGALLALSADYTSIDVYLCEPEVIDALWGLELDENGNPLLPAKSTMDRRLRQMDLQLRAGPDVPVHALRRGALSAGVLPLVEQAVDNLPPVGTPEREAAVAQFSQMVEELNASTWDENRERAAQGRRAEWFFDAESHTIYHQPLRGPRVAVLQLDPHVPAELVAEIVHRLLRPQAKFVLEADQVTAWVGEQPVAVATVLTRTKRLLDTVADALFARRR